MGKHQFCKLIRSFYFTFSPEEAFQVSVKVIDGLEHDEKVSHDLALYGLKLAHAYLELLNC